VFNTIEKVRYLKPTFKFAQALSIALLFSANTFSQTNVLFGERNLINERPAIFFDKNGTIYPDHFIPDSLLRSSDASLDTFYLKHTNKFRIIAQQYNCSFGNYSPQNAVQLQDSIFSKIRNSINQKYPDTIQLTFLVHGFRKSFVNKPGNYTSVIDYNILEDTLKKLSTKPSGIIRVFWDGMYGEISFKRKRYKAMFCAFVQSQTNAVNVGKSLRKFVSELPNHQLNFISHSLGARVVCTALFDTTVDHSPTPSQQTVNICLIAPAIDGSVFNHYYERSTAVDFKSRDNYRLLILYNKKDFVLRKRDYIFGMFGPGPNRYGKTTLGCDHRHEICKLQNSFKDDFPHSEIEVENMTKVIEKCHHLRCYCRGENLKGLIKFIEQ